MRLNNSKSSKFHADMSLTESLQQSMLIHTRHGKVLSNLNLVTNIKWEKPQAMRHVVISAQVDRRLCQSEDAYL